MARSIADYQKLIEEIGRTLDKPQQAVEVIRTRFHELGFFEELADWLACLLRTNKSVTTESLGLAVLGGLVASGQLSLHYKGKFIRETRFVTLAESLRISTVVARVLYRSLLSEWVQELPRPQSETAIGRFLALRKAFASPRQLVAHGATGVSLKASLSLADAQRALNAAIQALPGASIMDVALPGPKSQDHECCPPFSDPRWDARFDYFGPTSRLAELVVLLKEQVAEAIQLAYRTYLLASLRADWTSHGLGDTSLNTLGGVQVEESLENLNDKTTRQEVEAWVANVRAQLEVIKSRLRVQRIRSEIHTGDDNGWWAGGDGDEVDLLLTDASFLELMNVKGTNFLGAYDDGGTAYGYFDGSLPELEITAGAKQALNIRGVRLRYTSDNTWLFESALIQLQYEDNPYSGLLTRAQSYADSWDLIHHDTDDGEISQDTFDFWILASSRLARVQSNIAVLESALASIMSLVTVALANNFYAVNADALIAAFRDAALNTSRGEQGAARALYESALALLEPVASTDLDQELVFALHCLIADTYLAQGSANFAYGQLRKGWDYLSLNDTQSRDYLWLKLAEAFLRWGDQLYAAAGSDFGSRLAALPFYRKVHDDCMRLTYADDGAEDEVIDLWMDFSVADGTLPSIADQDVWVGALSVHCGCSETADVLGIDELDSSGTLMVPRKTVATLDHTSIGLAGTPGAFLRVQFETREAEVLRGDLDLIVATTEGALAIWKPACVRVQARFARYNPETVGASTPLHGTNNDLESFRRSLGEPLAANNARYWQLSLGAAASIGAATICHANGCIAELLQARAMVRRDQIRAHLNMYCVHDEYVPNGRFQSLNRMAQELAERAAYFDGRYTDFLLRAEATVLEELDAIAMSELARENVGGAELRSQQASVAAAAARERLAAAGLAQQQAIQISDEFSDSEEPWLLRHLNNVSWSYPFNFSVNIGGALGTLTGLDGYDEAFSTQEMQYRAAVNQGEASVIAAQFQLELADIEVALSQSVLRIERLQAEHVAERLQFVRTRTLTSTYWYETSRIYKALAESQLLNAGRWAWLAERALENEINVAVDVTRMDYHLLPLGAERLVADLDRQRIRLAEFRDRYRDVPNIIEREFRFSTDFPEQFRAITSSADAAPVERLGRGVRAIEFRTAMHAYDARLHGRYAFGRVLGVELELQTDVSPGVFTGHLENGRVVTVTEQGVTKRVQLSSSLVRVPKPQPVVASQTCVPDLGLDNSNPCAPTTTACSFPDADLFNFDIRLWDPRLQWILDLIAPVGPRLEVADRARGSTVRDGSLLGKYGSTLTRQGVPLWPAKAGVRENARRMRKLLLKLRPLVRAMWKANSSRVATPRVEAKARDKRVVEFADRARKARVYEASLLFLSRELVADAPNATDIAARRRHMVVRREPQVRRFCSRLFAGRFTLGPDELDTLMALRAAGNVIRPKRFMRHLAQALGAKRGLGWSQLSLRRMDSFRVVSRDMSGAIALEAHASDASALVDIVDDYITYNGGDTEYVLRVKHHDAESLSLSNFTRRDDAMVFNPYNPGDQLGVFENTGIDSWWRITLRALPANPLNQTPQWDKIREIVFRVWYHAAYERGAGFRLAEVLEPQAIRLAARKTLEVSMYEDFYDEFRTLIGDFDMADPQSLAAVRSYTDQSHPQTNGWIAFTIDADLVPQPGQQIVTALLLFTAQEPSSFPSYVWSLRHGMAGPVFTGSATGDSVGNLATLMSRTPPDGYRGLDPMVTWYFRMSEADNAGRGLAPLTDIRLILEFAPI